MKTGRTVALGLSVIMAASVMAGCGGSGSTTDQKGEAKAEASAEPVVLHWWGSFAENMGPALRKFQSFPQFCFHHL